MSQEEAGLLLIDKAKGPTSADVIRALTRVVGRKVKIGHAGTLDPDGEGLLVVLIGEATKLSETVMDLPKEYVATMRFGITTDTYDSAGSVTATADASKLTRDEIEASLGSFRGAIEQVPPPYSAVKVKGKRAYELARKGVATELAARPAMIYSLELLSYEFPDAKIAVRCGKGMYLRSLAHDIGNKLGVGAHVSELRRTSVGALKPELKVEEATKENWKSFLRDGASIFEGEPVFILSHRGALALRRGLPVRADDFLERPKEPVGKKAGVLDENRTLIAVASIGHGGILADRRIIRSL